MAKHNPSYPKMDLALFEQSASLRRMSEKAINAARYILVDVMSAEEAGLKAGYTINSAKSAASRAAANILSSAKVCPCCKRPI